MAEHCRKFITKSKNSRLKEKAYSLLRERDWKHLENVLVELGRVSDLKHKKECVTTRAHDVLIFSKQSELESGRWKEGTPRKIYMRGSSCDCENCKKGGEHCFKCLKKDLHGEWIHVEVIRKL